MTPPQELRRELVEVAHTLHRHGWVANHDGNVTARLARGRFLITPTAVSKRVIDESMLVVVDEEGRKVSGRMKPFSELGLHLTVYGQRPDVEAVVHAHPPTATGLSWAGASLLDVPAAPEPIVSLGPGVPTVPYAPPGAQAEAALRPWTRTHNAVLLANHGALTWGPDLETAYLRMELVEHMARCTQVAPGFRTGGGADPDLAAIIGAEVARALKRG